MRRRLTVWGGRRVCVCVCVCRRCVEKRIVEAGVEMGTGDEEDIYTLIHVNECELGLTQLLAKGDGARWNEIEVR